MLDNLHEADSLLVRTETDQAIEAMVSAMAARLDEVERLLNRIYLWRGQLPSDLHGDIAEFMGSEDLAIIVRACGELDNG